MKDKDRGDVIVEFVQSFIDEHGYSPTYQEIWHGCGLSSSSHAKHWIDKLENEGRVTMVPNSPRTIRVVA